MTSERGSSPNREPTPTLPLSSIPQKRALEEGRHSPVVPSPLNPEIRPSESLAPEDAATQAARSKSVRTKKDTLKKREAKGGDSARATPDPRPRAKEPKQSESSPLRYKLAPPKLSDFDLPRGPLLTAHHAITTPSGEAVEFFETSDQ